MLSIILTKMFHPSPLKQISVTAIGIMESNQCGVFCPSGRFGAFGATSYTCPFAISFLEIMFIITMFRIRTTAPPINPGTAAAIGDVPSICTAITFWSDVVPGIEHAAVASAPKTTPGPIALGIFAFSNKSIAIGNKMNISTTGFIPL